MCQEIFMQHPVASSQQPCEVEAVITPILQRRK